MFFSCGSDGGLGKFNRDWSDGGSLEGRDGTLDLEIEKRQLNLRFSNDK